MDSDISGHGPGHPLLNSTNLVDKSNKTGVDVFYRCHSFTNAVPLRLPVIILVFVIGFYFVPLRLYQVVVGVYDVFCWSFIPVTTLYLTSSTFRAMISFIKSHCSDISLRCTNHDHLYGKIMGQVQTFYRSLN